MVKELSLDNSHSRFVEGEKWLCRVELKDGDRVFLGSNEGDCHQSGTSSALNAADKDYLQDFELIHMGLYSPT